MAVGNVCDPQELIQSDRFIHIQNVPIMREHTRRVNRQRVLKFGPNELKAVVNKCNSRIQETGDFAAITIGHVPDESSGTQPKVVGYCGPFRVGWLNKTKSVCAILGDFHIAKEYENVLKEFSRRSPELWVENRYEDMYIDPIALLGGETPWSDLGILRYTSKNGKPVLKYSAAALDGVSPGMSNTFIPSMNNIMPKKKEKYAMEDYEHQQLADMLISILDNHPAIQWATRHMNQAAEEPIENPQGGASALHEPVKDTDASLSPGIGGSSNDLVAQSQTPQNTTQQQPELPQSQGPPQPQPEIPQNTQQPPALQNEDAWLDELFKDKTNENDPNSQNMPEKKPAHYCGTEYSKETDTIPNSQPQGDINMSESSKIQELEETLAKQAELLEKLTKFVCGRDVANTNVARYSKLSELSREFVLDVDDEKKRCDYENMTDEEFDDHVGVIKANYRKQPNAMGLPFGIGDGQTATMADDHPGNESNKVEYAKTKTAKTFNDLGARQRQGEHVSFDDVLAACEDIEE